jgi:hypothetical protein
MRKAFVFAVVSSAMAIAGCYSAPETTTPTPTPVVATPTPTATPEVAVTTPTPAVTSTRTIKNKDGSTTVEYLHVDGSKTEVRTFPTSSTHSVAKVSRTTSSTGTMKATVTYKDDTSGELKEKGMTEKAMTATGDALSTAEKETVSGVKTAADATEKAAKATAAGAQTVGKATAKGAEKAGKATAEGAKKVGEATAEGAKKVGEVFTGKKKATPTPKAN